ncbi:MAG: hypothetical protein WCL18_08355 [bacterium]
MDGVNKCIVGIVPVDQEVTLPHDVPNFPHSQVAQVLSRYTLFVQTRLVLIQVGIIGGGVHHPPHHHPHHHPHHGLAFVVVSKVPVRHQIFIVAVVLVEYAAEDSRLILILSQLTTSPVFQVYTPPLVVYVPQTIVI